MHVCGVYKDGLRFRKSSIVESLTLQDRLLISVLCRLVDKQEKAITEWQTTERNFLFGLQQSVTLTLLARSYACIAV